MWEYLLDAALHIGSGGGTDLAARARRLVDESARRTGPLCLLQVEKKFEYFRFLHREAKLFGLLHPWSIQNTTRLRYLRLTGLVGVIVQLQLLKIQDVFDVSCFVIPSTCFC